MTKEPSNTYLPEYANQAYRLCLIGGTTDKQLSQFFDVPEKTIENWKHDHPDFLQSIAIGRQIIGDDEGEGLCVINLAGGYPVNLTAAKEYLAAIEGDKHG